MKKFFILLLLLVYILNISADKFNKKKKDPRSLDRSFDRADGHNYPADIIDSVHSNIPGDPQIKINFAGMDKIDDDQDATISIETESEDDEDEDDEPIRKKKLPKSKTEDIHSFL